MIPRFDLELLQFIETHQVNNILRVPPVILVMVKYTTALGCDLSSLRRVGRGAAPLSMELEEEFRRQFPWVGLQAGYRLTESCGATMMFECGDDAKRLPDRCRGLLPSFGAKIIDAETG
ncbi:unnamed protein product [Linum trigynum]|uniref:AMP-dependent synthetase/ligase domain-containing protein n=1 Tax=Linum trigynum TaxID=586398 RepID=A0AAV2DVQ0_9ROSI